MYDQFSPKTLRIAICYLALKALPNESLVSTLKDILYTIEYHQEREEYQAKDKSAKDPLRAKVTVKETRVRPPFYLPYDEDIQE